jgi:hypothetical protein
MRAGEKSRRTASFSENNKRILGNRMMLRIDCWAETLSTGARSRCVLEFSSGRFFSFGLTGLACAFSWMKRHRFPGVNPENVPSSPKNRSDTLSLQKRRNLSKKAQFEMRSIKMPRATMRRTQMTRRRTRIQGQVFGVDAIQSGVAPVYWSGKEETGLGRVRPETC